ncbi:MULTISPECIES: ABC transporter substrate-binding protein [Arthrobacter]|uniref:ABC transporter substrate-binding protein n=2 Tax=Arthrobacter jinronghuae TaxID=2964609 RepID=A0ABT1NSC2_9MICC|nr:MULTISPECIES: ABC transporter substrate-binding protein [Arthrobacter]MCQ1950628.1 ABC transporter substrate-binding protein [Arthrobacter jinronghuae]MCQ1953951.1 ABC transporter substrate-binding protein [Arthrobacter sp. zg-Y238]MCQ1956849.1 ABC transporter substrate-binding protein [Arthrobacter jinronghuae]UWX79106.1 ABC transporter substrate-binding protein [Arthrobacter jinronghuae]
MKPILRVLAASTAVLALAACGSGSPSGEAEDTGEAGGGELTQVTVGVIPIVDVAPIYLGVQEGFFEEEGLELELQPAQGGAAIVPAVMSGSMDFGFSNISSMLVAKSKGLDVQVVAAGAASTGEDGADFGGILVNPDAGIETAADLAGKKVAVNTLNNINDTTVRASVRKAGGDPSGIEFVELAFPDMQAALERGQVDAIQVVEPFLTGGQNAGSTPIASNYVDTAEDLTVAGYFTTSAKAEDDAETVEKFTAAMNKSLEYAEENPDAVREVLLTYTKIDAETAKALTLPSFTTEINRAGVETLAELSLSDGLISEEPKLDELLP